MSRPLRDDALSDGLSILLEMFQEHEGADAVEISGDSLNNIIRVLKVTHRLSINLEHELAVHRLAEDGRLVCGVLDAEASDAVIVTSDDEGKVFTLDFGRKS